MAGRKKERKQGSSGGHGSLAALASPAVPPLVRVLGVRLLVVVVFPRPEVELVEVERRAGGAGRAPAHRFVLFEAERDRKSVV